MFWKTSIVSLDGACALLVAAFELADQRNVHAADEADLAGLGRHAGEKADEVGTFFFLVDDRADVRLVDDGVNDDELGVREFSCNLLDGRGPGEGNGDNRVEAAACEVADSLLALGVAGRLEVAIGDTGFLLELFGAVKGCFVEGLIELPAGAVNECRLDVGGKRRRGHGSHGKEGQKGFFHECSPVVCYLFGVLPQACFQACLRNHRPPPEAWLGASLHGSTENSPEIFRLVKICRQLPKISSIGG